MAKKKGGEAITFQIECDTEIQWRALLRKEGLIVVDVYASWAGPCVSMINILKRIKVEVNDDRLLFATACSDKIDDLLMFKDQSEPTWLFLGGGTPVRFMRGCHVPNLTKAVKQEFDNEMLCMEGKANRHVISIDTEEGRKRKRQMEAEAAGRELEEEAEVQVEEEDEEEGDEEEEGEGEYDGFDADMAAASELMADIEAKVDGEGKPDGDETQAKAEEGGEEDEEGEGGATGGEEDPENEAEEDDE